MGPLPVLESVNTCAAEVVPKFCEANVPLPVRVPVGLTPVPVSVAVARPVALEVTVRAPVRLPVTVGVKTTLTAQLELIASDVPQLLLWAKS